MTWQVKDRFNPNLTKSDISVIMHCIMSRSVRACSACVQTVPVYSKRSVGMFWHVQVWRQFREKEERTEQPFVSAISWLKTDQAIWSVFGVWPPCWADDSQRGLKPNQTHHERSWQPQIRREESRKRGFFAAFLFPHYFLSFYGQQRNQRQHFKHIISGVITFYWYLIVCFDNL